MTVTSTNANATPLFTTLAEAQAFLAQEVSGGKEREIYSLKEEGFDDIYIVALNVSRANDHAVRVLKARHNFTLGKVGKAQPTIEEQVKGMDADQLKALKALISAQLKD